MTTARIEGVECSVREELDIVRKAEEGRLEGLGNLLRAAQADILAAPKRKRADVALRVLGTLEMLNDSESRGIQISRLTRCLRRQSKGGACHCPPTGQEV